MQTRRLFLRSSSIAAFGIGAAPLWLTRAVRAADQPRSKKILVAILQRGAMDGLSAVVPYGESPYYALRPNLAVAKPGGDQGVIDLDGFFGLHPAMAPLKPLYDEHQLAIIHAAGSPDITRSHFDAQDYMESGTPGRKSTSDGWLNRSLTQAEKSAKVSPVRAVSIGPSLARTLRGSNDAIAIANLEGFQVRDTSGADSFESMYESTLDKVMSGAGHETFEAVKLIESIRKQPYTPANGAQYPNGLGQGLMQIARLIKAGVGLEVAFADMGGWDTHSNQPARMQTLLTEFSGALAAFHKDLGERMSDVCVVTMSEFGRTAKENGSRGTDHGHANVMFAMGGGVKGGKIHGEWPGLAPDHLYEQRDLAVTTDFRDVLGEVIAKHLGNTQTTSVFPGYANPQFRGLLVG
ncbi:MAG: DUF1501 domain-containing protein [Acidobacteriota bacterium]